MGRSRFICLLLPKSPRATAAVVLPAPAGTVTRTHLVSMQPDDDLHESWQMIDRVDVVRCIGNSGHFPVCTGGQHRWPGADAAAICDCRDAGISNYYADRCRWGDIFKYVKVDCDVSSQ